MAASPVCARASEAASAPSARRGNEVWRTVACIPADLPPEARFEFVRALEGRPEDAAPDFEIGRGSQAARATLSRDASAGREGGGAWKIDYAFEGREGIEAIHLGWRKQATLAEAGLGIGFWIRHEGVPLVVRARFVDAGGETHQIDLKSDSRQGWQYVTARFDEHGTSWGGDGNGRRDYPCRLTAVFFDRPKRGYKASGAVWLAEPRLLRSLPERHTLKTEVDRPPFGLLYSVGSNFALRAEGRGERLRWRIVDYYGKERAAGGGRGASALAEWRIDSPGYYKCILEMDTEGRITESQSCPFAALEGGRVSERSDFIGVCTHFGQQRYPLACMDLMLAYGLHRFRDEISWQSFERRKGERRLPGHAETYLEYAWKLGMKPLIILDYGNSHYDDGGYPNSPEAIDGFGAYSVELLRQARGRIEAVEVWNEWTGGCGMKGKPGIHDGASYGRLLKATHATIRAAFPDLTIVGIGGEDGLERRPKILEAFRVSGPAACDAWSIHPYRYPQTPEESDLVGEVTADAAAVRQLGVRGKTWITETGYPTHRTARGTTEEDQAALLIRTLALLRASGVVERTYWYDFKDDGLSRDYNEDNFGLVHHERFLCSPKPGVVALSAYVRLTGAATSVEAFPSLPKEARAVRFVRPSGQEVVVLWTVRGSVTTRWRGKVEALVGLMGEERSPGATIVASPTPLYLIGRDLSCAKATDGF